MDLENTIVLSEISQTETDKYSTPALVCVCYPLSRGRLFETPWTVAHQAPWSIEFSRQEYWSGLPFPSPAFIYGT